MERTNEVFQLSGLYVNLRSRKKLSMVKNVNDKTLGFLNRSIHFLVLHVD